MAGKALRRLRVEPLADKQLDAAQNPAQLLRAGAALDRRADR
jgi:hypothetical protein